jgi:hypothetical protein
MQRLLFDPKSRYVSELADPDSAHYVLIDATSAQELLEQLIDDKSVAS